MKKSLGPRTLAFPTPVWVVGTYDANDKPHVMTAAWGPSAAPNRVPGGLPAQGHLFLRQHRGPGRLHGQRALRGPRQRGGLLRHRQRPGRQQIHPARLNRGGQHRGDAPMWQNSPGPGVQLLHTIEIGLHTQFIGEIIDVKPDEAVLGEKGLPDIEKVKPIIFGPEIAAITASVNSWARPSPSAVMCNGQGEFRGQCLYLSHAGNPGWGPGFGQGQFHGGGWVCGST